MVTKTLNKCVLKIKEDLIFFKPLWVMNIVVSYIFYFTRTTLTHSTFLFNFTSILCFSSQSNITCNLQFFMSNSLSVNFNLPFTCIYCIDINILHSALLLLMLLIAFLLFTICHVMQLLLHQPKVFFSLNKKTNPLLSYDSAFFV